MSRFVMECRTLNYNQNMNSGQILQAYQQAEHRLFLLDYDGVLTPIVRRPELAKPSNEVRELLRTLGSDPRNECVIISGRKHEELEQWLGDLPLSFVAEHGLWQKTGHEWSLTSTIDTHWKDGVRAVMQEFALRLPGALIEEKYAALAFHYREADPHQAEQIVKQLTDKLRAVLGSDLSLLEGKKVIEVLVNGITKGQAAQPWLNRNDWDFVMAAGDDVTDESLFRVLLPTAYSFKIGEGPTAARHTIKSQAAFIGFLNRFIEK